MAEGCAGRGDYGWLRSLEMTQVTFASLREYVIKRVNPCAIVLSVDGVEAWVPKDVHVHHKSRVLPRRKMNATGTYVHAMEHVLYGLSIVQSATIVVSRVDVEYASHLTIPPILPNSVTVPTFQNYGHLNDRFCIGTRLTLLRWFEMRHSLAQRSVISERGACDAAKALKLIVSRTDVKFVRRRSDLFVPDVDKATVWNSIPLRAWMRSHAKSCL